MKPFSMAILFLFLIAIVCCSHQRARSEKSFDEIRDMVQGKTAAEVERMLGKPDSHEAMPVSGERWIWWNYTYLDGNNYAPEERGRIVHLEIVFESMTVGTAANPSRPSQAELRVGGPLGVSYTLVKETT